MSGMLPYGVMLMARDEYNFVPYAVESEEEAQDLVRSLVEVLRRTVDASPIWEQHEFSQRAENVLRRNQVSTWSDLLRAIDKGCLPGGGSLVLKEFSAAIFAKKWGGQHDTTHA